MRVCGVHVRRFKSIAAASLEDCGPLNVLIGRNNAGKSNMLAALDLAFWHLKRGTAAGSWVVARPLDELTGRRPDQIAQVGLEFELPSEINRQLRERLTKEGPHLDKSIEQLAGQTKISFILGCSIQPRPFVFTQSIATGAIRHDGPELVPTGMTVLTVPPAVGLELALIQESVSTMRADIGALENVMRSRELDVVFAEGRDEMPQRRYFIDRLLGNTRLSPRVMERFAVVLRSSPGVEEFQTATLQSVTELRDEIKRAEQRQTEGSIGAFAGDTKIPPAYAAWLMQQYGMTSVLHLHENKHPIGRPEAQALLNLKITRGGPERLRLLQSTVRALLGVNIDAFSQDPRSETRGDRAAEMDIDEFLVEVNGAGIREALRIILDLELQNPALALIEEPEVHLHPGLERALEGYLRDRSNSSQMFVTTHSTNFIDAAAFQNVYLVSRSPENTTVCEPLSIGDAAFKLPAELGLRLSTVFMFDHLVFVEGPSDEAVLRVLAAASGVELARSNVGFVHLGGVRNFAHYAAEHTIDVLSRRQVRLSFVLDRDEADDAEIRAMMTRLGERASLRVLQRRELENYLLQSDAVLGFIQDVRQRNRLDPVAVTSEQVADDIRVAAEELKDEVIRLRVGRKALGPIHLQRRGLPEGVKERLEAAVDDLRHRLESLPGFEREVASQIDDAWPRLAIELAPGSKVLEAVCSKYGVSFDKSSGHSAQIARFMIREQILPELQPVLRLLGE